MQSNRGFTLIELLVTIAIVAILASMAMAQFTVFRARANDVVALSAIRNVQTAAYASPLENVARFSLSIGPDKTENLWESDLLLPGTNTISAYPGSDGVKQMLPGYVHPEGVELEVRRFGPNHSSREMNLQGSAIHCRGTINNPEYDNPDYWMYKSFHIGAAGKVAQYERQGFSCVGY